MNQHTDQCTCIPGTVFNNTTCAKVPSSGGGTGPSISGSADTSGNAKVGVDSGSGQSASTGTPSKKKQKKAKKAKKVKKQEKKEKKEE